MLLHLQDLVFCQAAICIATIVSKHEKLASSSTRISIGCLHDIETGTVSNELGIKGKSVDPLWLAGFLSATHRTGFPLTTRRAFHRLFSFTKNQRRLAQ